VAGATGVNGCTPVALIAKANDAPHPTAACSVPTNETIPPGARPAAEIGPQTISSGGPTTHGTVCSIAVAPPRNTVPGGPVSENQLHDVVPVFCSTKSYDVPCRVYLPVPPSAAAAGLAARNAA